MEAISPLPCSRLAIRCIWAISASCSISCTTISVLLTTSGIPKARNISALRGSLTRAITFLVPKCPWASWAATRLSWSTPVTAITQSALRAPAASSTSTLVPSPGNTAASSSSASCTQRARSFSIRQTSCLRSNSSRARLFPACPPPTTIILIFSSRTRLSLLHSKAGRQQPC